MLGFRNMQEKLENCISAFKKCAIDAIFAIHITIHCTRNISFEILAMVSTIGLKKYKINYFCSNNMELLEKSRRSVLHT